MRIAVAHTALELPTWNLAKMLIQRFRSFSLQLCSISIGSPVSISLEMHSWESSGFEISFFLKLITSHY